MATAAAYAPPPYPSHRPESRRLPDGTAVVIRPIHPEDDAIERVFITGLSRDTRYNRLLGARKLTPEEIRRLTHIDYVREMAFVAVTESGGQTRLLGVSRYVRDVDGGGAEFALVIADAWQKKGLGSLLLAILLRHAQAAGIGRLHGVTLATNQGMLNLARKLGFVRKLDLQDATVRLVEKKLTAGVLAVAAHSNAGYGSIAANDEGIAPSAALRPPESFRNGQGNKTAADSNQCAGC